MGLTPEEVQRLGDTAKVVIRGEQMKQVVDAGTTSERAFAADLRRAGIHDFKRNWPQKSRGESWPAPIRKNWELDFAWIDVNFAKFMGNVQVRAWKRRSLGVFLDGKAHMFTKADGLAGTGGKRTADYQRANVLQHVLGPLGFTVFYFTPSDIGQGVALRSVQAWLRGDDEGLLMALQGKPIP